jgi:hypothetical protein
LRGIARTLPPPIGPGHPILVYTVPVYGLQTVLSLVTMAIEVFGLHSIQVINWIRRSPIGIFTKFPVITESTLQTPVRGL